MDEIKERLKDCSDACISTYETWRAKTSDHAARAALMEAVHELRKVAARLEIELAVADRQQNPNDPIPIPSHRASRRPAQQPADDIGNGNGNGNSDDFGNRERGPRRTPQNLQPRSNRPAPRPVAASEGNETSAPAPAATGEDGQPQSKPLSLKRVSNTDEG